MIVPPRTGKEQLTLGGQQQWGQERSQKDMDFWGAKWLAENRDRDQDCPVQNTAHAGASAQPWSAEPVQAGQQQSCHHSGVSAPLSPCPYPQQRLRLLGQAVVLRKLAGVWVFFFFLTLQPT